MLHCAYIHLLEEENESTSEGEQKQKRKKASPKRVGAGSDKTKEPPSDTKEIFKVQKEEDFVDMRCNRFMHPLWAELADRNQVIKKQNRGCYVLQLYRTFRV